LTTPKTPQIVSVSRRTDIPALYSDWFFNRLSDGYCRVTNPFNAHQVKRVSLTPADVKAFVFWSKNPQPMMDHLSILDDNNYQYLFLFTLNNYPAWLEANIPDLAERTNTFRQLSGYIGADRTVWRYDPIIFTAKLDIDYHNRVFESLCNKELVGLESLSDEQEIMFVKQLIEKHYSLTNSKNAHNILTNWRQFVLNFVKVIPHDYKRILSENNT